MPPQIDLFWIILSGMLVFVMQIGFLLLESGFTRNKNNINVSMKNIADFAVTVVLYWAFGFAFMFGASESGLIGLTRFAPDTDPEHIERIAFFAFQLMFCGTAVTIVSGAIAERVRFGAYMIVSILVSGLVYPLFGHWAWNGADAGVASGLLNRMGFVDFAGSSVVHSVGGWVSLAVLVIIGARTGRFDAEGKPQKIPGSNLTLATAGVMLLWFGWFGFNGGSALAFNDVALRALVNTVMGGATGLIAGVLLGYAVYRRVDVGLLLNGTLAGLVGITANAHAVTLGESAIIGAISVLFMYGGMTLLERLKIDDAVGAVPVHLFGGIWGTLAVGIFGHPDLLNTGLERGEQIIVQGIGIAVCAVWTFGTTYTIAWTVNKVARLRVTPEDEQVGLNISEHNERTDLIDLFDAMDHQARTGDLTLRVPVEPFTEIGQIANRYNYVIASLQQALARADAIVRTVNDAMVTVNAQDLRILSLNPAGESIFGYSALNVHGDSLGILIPSISNSAALEVFVKRLMKSERAEEIEAVRADGESFPAELTITRFEQGASLYYTATFRDISLRKIAERERQHLRELELKAQMAVESSRLKSDFVSTVTHELRTPLNSLIGYSGLLLMGVRGKIDDEAREVISTLEASSKHLLVLINDMLDIDKIESGQFRLASNPLIVRDLVDEWIDPVRVLAEPKGLTLQTVIAAEFPPILMGDGERLTQIALNLLSNAIKFTEHGGVRLTLRHLDDQWSIEVRDTGIGISEPDQQIIFEKFRQVDSSTSRQYAGTGLGLAIVQQLATAMGGTVGVNSRLRQGSTFTVTLPLILPTPEADV